MSAALQYNLPDVRAKDTPQRVKEAWKYTRLALNDAQRTPYVASGECAVSGVAFLPGHDGIAIVDGRFEQTLSTVPEGVSVSQEADKAIVSVALRRGVQLTKPLEIHYVVSAKAEGSVYTGLQMALEEDASCEIVERFSSELGEAEIQSPRAISHHAMQAKMKRGARWKHIRVQDMTQDCFALYAGKVEQSETSEYDSFSFQCGAALARQEVDVILSGSRARTDQRGVTLAAGRQHMDAYLPVDHASPDCYSNQHFRQLLAGNATGVFYGSIHVPPESIKTEAHQLSRNLLLDQGAKAYTRPELDILTDDVVCSHGATIGRLDAQAMYYLQARGLSESEARALLVEAFVCELVEEIGNDALETLLKQLLQAWSEQLKTKMV